MSRNKEHRGAAFDGAPNGAAAEGGHPTSAATPLGATPKAAPLCSLFLLIYCSYYQYFWMFLLYSLYIPHIYFLNMFHIYFPPPLGIS